MQDLLKIEYILATELRAAKKRRSELKNSEWIDNDDTLLLRLAPISGKGYISSYVCYIGDMDLEKGELKWASLQIGWKSRLGGEGTLVERIRELLEEFADGLRDGTIPAQQIVRGEAVTGV